MLYLDAAATTPVRREALEAAWPYLTGSFGNPSSVHELGASAARGLREARASVATWLGCRPGDVVFTSGGTEGANLAIAGLALANPRGRHLVVSPTEHEAVLETADYLRRLHGFSVSFAAVDASGLVTPDALRAALRSDTALVSIGYANNEIGTVQDIPALAAVAHAAGALFHSDAVQAAGRLALDVGALGIDALSFSGHKLGAPKGSGAVYLRGTLPVEPLLHGGGQERGRRSGTENVAWAVALGAAVRVLPALAAPQAPAGSGSREWSDMDVPGARERPYLTTREGEGGEAGAGDDAGIGAGTSAACADPARDDFIARVLGAVPQARLTGHPSRRLPGHASFVVPGVNGETVLLELERRGVVASAGAACAAGSTEPSHVLTAVGLDDDTARTALRFSWSSDTDAADLARAAAAVAESVAAVRAL